MSTLNPIQSIKIITDQFDQENLYNKETNVIDIDKMFAYSAMISSIIEDSYDKEIADDYEIYKYCSEKFIYPVKYEIENKMINDYNNYNDCDSTHDSVSDIHSFVERYKDMIILESDGSKIYTYVLNKIRFFHDSNFHMIPGQIIVKPFNSLKFIVLAN